MKHHKFSRRSLNNLYGVHPQLIRVVYRALELSPVDFGITEGLRTEERQQQLIAEGKSWTMRSYHLPRFGDKYGRAIDIVCYVDGDVTWDFDLYRDVADAFDKAAQEIGVVITWGGHWKSKDGPHFQLEDI